MSTIASRDEQLVILPDDQPEKVVRTSREAMQSGLKIKAGCSPVKSSPRTLVNTGALWFIKFQLTARSHRAAHLSYP